MAEKQTIEYKSSWHDDYLKWICGFANAQGGTIFIGKDDSGNIIDVSDYKKLMDDIPNKIRNSLGITVEVNLHKEKSKHYIEIITLPYSVPVSLRGRYYYRSGSTKQELTGASLNEFLLKKSGKTWDDIVEPRATTSDIDEATFTSFLKISENNGRLPETVGLTNSEILEKLRLSENGKLKRAAIVLFGKDPGKFYPNIFVKIGRFAKDDADIRFQEVEEGNLIVLLRGVLQQLNNKFLTRKIEFEGVYRIEKGEYPVPAIREMLLNALVHRSYMGAPVQLRVYDDKINIWNEGTLPEGLSIEALKRNHSSKPRNPVIAGVCFKGGLIDAWGRGTIRIFQTCKEAGLPEPELTERDGGFLVTLFKNALTRENLLEMGINKRQLIAVEFVKKNLKISNKEYQILNQISERTASRELADLVNRQILTSSETRGAGSYFYFAGIQ